MPISPCVTYLRETYSELPGGGLRSGHAHEIAAAYFGYPTYAALQAEPTYSVDALATADLLIPNIVLLGERISQLNGLPQGLPPAAALAQGLSSFLVNNGFFLGNIWHTDNLEEYINSDFLQPDPLLIMDALSGQMADTNATFDELYVEEVVLEPGPDALVASVSGSLKGDNDPDKPFSGDKIAFTTMITFSRIAGRVAFASPDLETSGEIDDSDYYDDDDD